MKRLLLLLSLACIAQLAVAQRYTVKGQIQDEKQTGLPSATVLILQAKDSSLVSFAATDALGNFEIKNVSKGDLLLKVTFLGYLPHFAKIGFPAEGQVLDLGALALQPLSNELKEVMVQGEKSPVVFKKDTIEYNAGSFKTQPNAVAEDLLKRLPGVDVETDGSISVKGEKVQRVTVDGKEFFGRDPKLATRNLPADAIDKVQVFDKKSDQAMFTGIDDGQREKTINLQLKEEKRNSAFGNAMAGIGTDERYQAKANLNRFSSGKQLSFLGMANNVNSQGFGFDEYVAFSGGMQQMGGGGGRVTITTDNSSGVPLNFGGRTNGLMDSYAGGLNFNNQLGKQAEANGSYFFNQLKHNIARDLERLDFLRNGDVRTNQNSRQNNGNANHRANFSVDYKIDSANSVKVTGAVGYNESSSGQRSQVETFDTNNLLQNQSNNTAFSDGKALNANGGVLLRHRFPKAGRTISSNTEFQASQNSRDGALQAVNSFADGTVNVLDQVNDEQTDNQSLSTTLAYTEPLGNRRYLEANYNYRQNLNKVNRQVYDLEEDETRAFNELLSNGFSSNYQFHRGGLNFRLNRREYSLTVGSSLQHTSLAGRLLHREGGVGKSYQNVLPTLRFNYEFTGNRRIDFNYETLVQEPTIRQLQPVVDNSNPLSIYQGNPELRPAYMHQGRLNFSTFDPGTLVNFFAFVNASYTNNAITNAQSYTDRLIRITQPVNVRSNAVFSGFASLGFPVKKLNSRFNLGTNVRQQESINIIDKVANDISIRSVNGNLRYEYRLKELFDFNLRANYTVQRTKYQFGEDQKFFNQTYSAESNLYLPKVVNINANFDYLLFDNPGFDFSQRIPMLNVSVSKQFLKNKSGELKLSALNMLDEDLGINQTANINYVERETLNSLGRYFMLSFTYSINKHLNPMANRTRGGAVRIVN